MTTYTIKSYASDDCSGDSTSTVSNIPEWDGNTTDASELRDEFGATITGGALNVSIKRNTSTSYDYYLDILTDQEPNINIEEGSLPQCVNSIVGFQNFYFLLSESSPAPDPSPASSSSGLSDEEVAGIIIGSIAAAILLYVLYIKYFTSN